MALLPNLDTALIEDQKLTQYLLSPTSRKGKHKAAFFKSFGFDRESWTVLRDALLDHARTHEAEAEPPMAYGIKYIVTGPLRCPDGRLRRVRAAWIVNTGVTFPRLVSVVPD